MWEGCLVFMREGGNEVVLIIRIHGSSVKSDFIVGELFLGIELSRFRVNSGDLISLFLCRWMFDEFRWDNID